MQKKTVKTTPKKPVAKKVVKKTAPAKKNFDPGSIWQSINNRSYGFGIGTGGRDNPRPGDLVCAFNDIVFSAINLIAPNVAKEANKYKLVVSTSRGDTQPRSNTKALGYHEKRRIEQDYPQYARRSVQLEEVIEHPVLDLLDKPNPHQTFQKLVELIDVYLELVGSAFVSIKKLQIGTQSIPTALWLLPSQYVTIECDEFGKLLGYRYKCGEIEQFFQPDEMIHFKCVNPQDPYHAFGISPVRAVWERVMLLEKEQASWDSVLSNMTFPTVLISPPDNEAYTPNQAQRIEKQLSEKGRLGGGQGGIWVVTEGMKINPFSTPPKDLSALQMYQTVRSSIATTFNIPVAMMDLSISQGATGVDPETSDTVRRNFQLYCLSPRIGNILETFSHALLPARMWLVADVVSPDKVFELQRTTALVSGDIITINEARIREGLEPKTGYDKLHCEVSSQGTPSAQTFQASAPAGRVKSFTRYRSSLPDAKPLEDALKRCLARLAGSIVGKLDKATAARTKAFFPLEDWTEEMRKELSPVLLAYFDEGMKSVLTAIGGNPELPRLAVLELDKAVNSAVLALAKSTLETTEKSVEDAIAQTRDAIREGLEHGEAHDQLAKRIGEVFEDLSGRRALLIAETESSRAKHTGELLAIDKAGVEAKKVWLPDSMACDYCRGFAKLGAVSMDKAFGKIGEGAYSVISSPPAHPNCRCTLQYNLEA